jgi:hypothetical protein
MPDMGCRRAVRVEAIRLASVVPTGAAGLLHTIIFVIGRAAGNVFVMIPAVTFVQLATA